MNVDLEMKIDFMFESCSLLGFNLIHTVSIITY